MRLNRLIVPLKPALETSSLPMQMPPPTDSMKRDAARDATYAAELLLAGQFRYHGSEGELNLLLAAALVYMKDVLRQNGIVL